MPKDCPKWRMGASIPLPPECESGALPFELIPQMSRNMRTNLQPHKIRILKGRTNILIGRRMQDQTRRAHRILRRQEKHEFERLRKDEFRKAGEIYGPSSTTQAQNKYSTLFILLSLLLAEPTFVLV